MRRLLVLALTLGFAAPAAAQPVTAFTPRTTPETHVAFTPPAPAPTPVRTDAYGPNPDGLVLENGQTVRCKLKRKKDRYYGGEVVWRVCWLE